MRSLLISAILVTLTFSAVACQSTPRQKSTATPPTAAPASGQQPNATSPRDSAALAYDLTKKTWATNDDAVSMIVMMTEGQDHYGTFADRLNALASKGIADKGWQLKSDATVTKGTLAYMLYKALNLKTGLMMKIIPSRRYAYREAVYCGLMYRGGELEPLTGPEMVAIIGRAVRPQERQ